MDDDVRYYHYWRRPAGASAALFFAKAGKKTLVVDADQSITQRAWIENHYGVIAVNGAELVEICHRQSSKRSKTDEGLRVILEPESFATKPATEARMKTRVVVDEQGRTTQKGV